jgi:hypothetical protein
MGRLTRGLQVAALAVVLLGTPFPSGAADAVTAYDERAASTGYFREGASVVPGAYQLYLQTPQSLGAYGGLGPRPKIVEGVSFKADAHAGVTDYRPGYGCLDCHAGSEHNLHSARTEVTCRQCHRGTPIAGIFHYYSAMNPIRRHAYVCAKCHEGATANFAAYVVHEPPALAAETAEGFPALYYATWFMVILAGGVFLFFLPFTVGWGFRELIQRIWAGRSHVRVG